MYEATFSFCVDRLRPLSVRISSELFLFAPISDGNWDFDTANDA